MNKDASDEVSFLREIEDKFKEINRAQKAVGEWEFEIEGISEISGPCSIIKVKVFVDSNGRYWAYTNISIDGYRPEGRSEQSAEQAVLSCLRMLTLKLRTSAKHEYKCDPFYL